MKKLILIPFLALVGCANNETSETFVEPDGPDPLFSFREEEFNDTRLMSNIIHPGNRMEYQVIGQLHFGDIDYITSILPSIGGHTVNVTLDIPYEFGVYARIETKTIFGGEQLLWTGLAEDITEVMVEIPENASFWTLGLTGSSLYVKDYIWRAEIEVY